MITYEEVFLRIYAALAASRFYNTLPAESLIKRAEELTKAYIDATTR